MKIFGLGLSKTGTTSLNTALNMLDIPSIHGPHDEKTQVEIMSGVRKLSILDRYDAITDIPMALYYVDLDRIYPKSKFILTVRNLDDWLKSMNLHYDKRPITKWNSFIRTCAYGCLTFHPERHAIAYQQHTSNVARYFAERNDLLVLNICEGEGWDQLCDFLGKPIPNSDFPWENKKSNNKPKKRYFL